MDLGKRLSVFHSRACYMLFEIDEAFNSNDNQKKENQETEHAIVEVDPIDTIMYNGPVKVFMTLRELNEQLAKKNAVNSTTADIERKLYKGHLFSAKEFPLEAENKENITFVIEKIDNNTCFVEQVHSLKDAAQSIEEEINMLLQHGIVEGIEASDINDYLIFHGEPMGLFYYCYDSNV